MSGAPDDSAEKSHEPSQKKLDDARRRGEVPKSTDLTTAAGYAGLLLVMIAFGSATLSAGGTALSSLVGQSDRLAELWFAEAATPLSLGLAARIVPPLSVWLGVPAIVVLIALIGQRGIVFSPERLQPKLSRVSLLSNAKNKFGRGGLFEFAKSAVKLTIYSVVLGGFLARQMPDIVTTSLLAPAGALVRLGALATGFMAIVLTISLAIGVVDLLWQHQEHIRKNMMSRKELTDEHKQSEGDPHVKQQRRQRAQEIAMNSMLADVPDADVVVVNPTHYAVALKWNRSKGAAPICVAKGVDEIAARIRETAVEAGVPVHRDPPTARALYATVGIGDEVRPEHYKAVAAAIRFAERMRQRARRGHGVELRR